MDKPDTSYVDISLTNGTTYYYRICAVDTAGNISGYSEEVQATPAKQITVTLPGGATMTMVWIEPGTFMMGSPETEPDRSSDEGPQHEVTITQGFYLGKYELTQEQWESVMGTSPWEGRNHVQDAPNNPAVYISWDDMQLFIAALNTAEGDSVYRLPTEAEWEYTCRAGTTTRWSFGDDAGQLGQYAWHIDNAWWVGEQYAHEVGTKLANPWGLFDMHGNVMEWVQDIYDRDYYSVSPIADPMGPITGSHRVARGGCIVVSGPFMRSAAREDITPDYRHYDAGARLLRQHLRLYGDVTDNGEVTAYDAAKILQHTVGLLTLTGEDSVAAEVSGNDTISAYDASLVLQYVVGKIARFPVEEGQQAKVACSPRTVWMGEMETLPDGRMCLPILIDEMDGVVAGELTLSFSGDAGDVTVSTSALTSGYLLASNVRDGCIRASFAGAESSTGPGPVLEVVFDNSDAELLGSLRLDRVSLNEGRIPVRIEGVKPETSTAYRLGPNYPNPFNPETTIAYDVAKTGTVRLSVYALTGQLVRTLVDGECSAGSYSVVWDGRDEAGRDVASGVYLCRMVAGEYSASRKLVLVR